MVTFVRLIKTDLVELLLCLGAAYRDSITIDRILNFTSVRGWVYFSKLTSFKDVYIHAVLFNINTDKHYDNP